SRVRPHGTASGIAGGNRPQQFQQARRRAGGGRVPRAANARDGAMIVPDVNLLLYAYDATSPFHAAAAAWWRACLSGSERVGRPLVVAFGFVRIGTSARVFEQPMPPSEAADHVRSWLAQP